jgi:hypothetical protein
MTTLKKEDYLAELNDIKDKLTDFLNQIQSGKPTYFKDVSLKLRILYCDKSRKKSLLKIIQQFYKFKAFVIIKHSLAEKVRKGKLPESLLEGLVFEQLNSVVGWFEFGDEFVPVFDAINKKDEILIQNKFYSYTEIFEAIADKMGGAHIDSTIPDEMLIPHSNNLLVGGFSVAHRATFDTAKASIMLIGLIDDYIKTKKETDFIKREEGAGI